MYTPSAYAHTDLAALHDGIEAWSFATLVSVGPEGPTATHLPFLLDRSVRQPEVDNELPAQGLLTTHMARANPQWRTLLSGKPCLVIFQGPHAFISPSWYKNQQTFPTWNYTAIHVQGTPTVIDDPSRIRNVLDRTVARYDTPLQGSWRFPDMPQALTQSRLSAIVAIDIPIARIEGKLKLNQDKSVDDRRGVVRALLASGDPQSVAVARMILQQPDMKAFSVQG
ncbi:FMN-binding negative transcriptional regulator [Bordetella tumulicola]|uniref:FMN-binding negative transcriptional regulator n=1 Tax=Bordetella tumulicola TaxID=1649133 RepID=UPI0039F011F3